MRYEIRTRSERTRRFINHVMPSMIQQLGLAKSRAFVLIEIGSQAGKSNDGSTIPLPGLNSYVICIRPAQLHIMGLTLAHEMVHVRQLAKGILRAEDGKKYWRGKLYSNRLKYTNQPWEQDALARQEIVFRRAIGE